MIEVLMQNWLMTV